MQLALDRRAQRILRRLPRQTVYTVAEIVLIALLAVQAARLLFAAITPVGPVGNWRADGGQAQGTAPIGILATFDPFFRLSDTGGPVVVTALDIKLFGTRADQASGRGSAIIGLADGSQASFAVGDEIMPGVTLKAVAFDNITVTRGSADEVVYIDQSQPADSVAPDGSQGGLPPIVPGENGPPPGIVPPPAPATGNAVQPQSLLDDTQATPRMGNGGVDGIILTPRGGGAFRAAGLQAGDVLVAIDGRAIGAQGVQQLQSQLAGQGDVAVEIERGGRRQALRIKAGQ